MYKVFVLLGAILSIAQAFPPVAPEIHVPKPYTFGYAIKDKHGEQHREETGDGVGIVQGSYEFTDERGIHRQVHYVADKAGFRAEVKTNEHGTAPLNPAAVKMISSAHPYLGGAGHVPLATGLAGLAAGPAPLAAGFGPLAAGPAQLTAGLGPLAAGPGPLTAGLGPLAAGPGPLAAEFGPLAAGPVPFSAGFGPLSAGPGPLTAGLGPLAAGPGPLAAEFGPLAAGPVPFSAGFEPLSAGPGLLAAGFGPQAVGPGPLSAELGTLAAGPRPLAAGFGPLAAGPLQFGFPLAAPGIAKKDFEVGLGVPLPFGAVKEYDFGYGAF